MKFFFALIVGGIAALLIKKLVYPRLRDSISQEDVPTIQEKCHRDPGKTEIMGRYKVTVFRPDGSVYMERYIPDNVSYYSIGASTSDDITIPDPRVSKAHILIGSDQRGLFLRDNNSTNGTRYTLDSSLIREDVDVKDNLKLYIGPVPIQFHDSCASSPQDKVLKRRRSVNSENKTRVFGHLSQESR